MIRINGNTMGSFAQILRYNIKDKLAAFAFILFFCSDILDAALFRIVPNVTDNVWEIIKPIENILLAIPIFLCTIYGVKNNKFSVWKYYLGIFVLFAVTWIIFPEYDIWFLHEDFGIENRFLVLTRGVYALLIISLFCDAQKIFNCLIIASKLNFIFYFLQYYAASVRGYWVGIAANGDTVELGYQLLFGYNMAFCLVVFLAAYIYTKKKSYLLYLPVGSYTMLMAGSRGALLCIAFFFANIYVSLLA